jgi:hypothetical protein
LGLVILPPPWPSLSTTGHFSHLLANIFLHELDRQFYGPRGPARADKARLVRYADDFVILARDIGARMMKYVSQVLQGLGLNRDKTRIVDLREPGERIFWALPFVTIVVGSWSVGGISTSCPRPQLPPGGDRKGQPVSGRLEPLLRLWLSQPGLPKGQLVSANPVSSFSADPEPTAKSV